MGSWTSQNTVIKVNDPASLVFDTTCALQPDEIAFTFNADKTFIGKPKNNIVETGTYNMDKTNFLFNSMGEIDSFTYTLSKDEFKLTHTASDETDSTSKTIETITYKRK